MQLFSIKTALEACGYDLSIFGQPPPEAGLPVVKATLVSGDILSGAMTAVDSREAAYHNTDDQVLLAIGTVFVAPPEIISLEVTNPIAPTVKPPYGAGRSPWLERWLGRLQPAEPVVPDPDPNSDASQDKGPLPI